MDIFDILGPVMVGPSSSHTAGAARIGKMARTLLGGEPMEAKIHLHGSFAETGSGHGTDRALVAGLLGMNPDDYKYYCDLRRYGSCRHAGYGLGFERMVMYLTGVNNIRDVELHPRTVGNADF